MVEDEKALEDPPSCDQWCYFSLKENECRIGCDLTPGHDGPHMFWHPFSGARELVPATPAGLWRAGLAPSHVEPSGLLKEQL